MSEADSIEHDDSPAVGEMPYNAILPFRAKSIIEMDGGRAEHEINRRIREIVEDIRARPVGGDGKATADRHVTIKLILRPSIETDEQTLTPVLDAIDGHLEINNSRPTTKGRPQNRL